MKNYRSTVIGFAILVVLMTAGAAQSLSGSNTVFTDDIADGNVTSADIMDGKVKSIDIKDNSVIGADVDEATLSPRTFFAQVASGGAATSASPGVTSAIQTVGIYLVTFPRNMAGCAATATSAGFNGHESGNTALSGYVETGFANVTSAGANQVGVIMGAGVSASFELIVVCP